MRFLKESLLSFFVAGVVLSFYFLAVGAALFSLAVSSPIVTNPKAVHHLKVPTDVTSLNQIHLT
jgi:hypothetical protein